MDGPLKRQRFSIGRHLCVFALSDDEEGNCEYRLYYLDLDSCFNTNPEVDEAGYTHILPTFRFDGHRPRAFSLLGSTLYIFEGYKYDSDYRGKSALKLDLCQTSYPVNHKFENLELGTVKLLDMCYSKFRPCAIPTPDGKKILVFATQFRGYEEVEDGTQFELYNPMANSWEKLPGLSTDPYQQWSLGAYSFIDDHVFFIQVNSGMFALDLESLDKGWKVLGEPRVRWVYGYFPAINNKFVFTCKWMYGVSKVGSSGDDVKPADVPLSSFPRNDKDKDRKPFDLEACFPSITLVHHDIDNGVVRWCVLRSQHARDIEDIEDATKFYTRVLIDVYDTHLATLKSTIIRSFKLVVDHYNWLKELEFVQII